MSNESTNGLGSIIQGLQDLTTQEYIPKLQLAIEKRFKHIDQDLKEYSRIRSTLDQMCDWLENDSVLIKPDKKDFNSLDVDLSNLIYHFDKYDRIGFAIKDLRLQVKIPQAQIAAYFHMSTKNINYLERDMIKITEFNRSFWEYRALEFRTQFADAFKFDDKERVHFMSLPFLSYWSEGRGFF